MAQKIPIFKDDLSFAERQGKVWGDMERDLERRRREWEDEIERMRKDFFTLKPDDNGRMDAIGDRFKMAGGNTLTDEARGVVEKDDNGRPVFRVRFNVNSYKPEEVGVKIDSNKLLVHARHEEKSDNKSVSREFNREVDIPRELDPMGLQCSMSTDGILTVEAPMPTPQYGAIKDSGSRGPQYEAIHQPNASSSPARNTPPPVIPQQQQQPLNQPPPPPPTSQQQQQQKHSSTFTTFLSGGAPAQSQPIKFQTTQPISSSQPQSPPFTPVYQMQSQPQQAPPSSHTVAQDGGDRKFKVDVDIEDFAPEELSVKTVDKRLVISARREEKLGNRTSTKELNREIFLPDTVDPYSVKAFFSDNGKLIVEAPYVRGVPVSHYGEGYQNTAAGR